MRLTRLEGRGYGSVLPVKNLLGMLAAALAVVGCNAGSTGAPAPLDRFTYPVGMDFQDGRLLVVSSNFDLAFAGSDGGSVLSVDPAAAPAQAFGSGVRIGSFGGEIAVVRAPNTEGTGPTTTDCGFPADTPAFALVASRLEDLVYKLDLTPGGLACGPDCVLHVGTSKVSDPYGVAVTCPPGGPARGWVGFLRAPTSESWIGTWELADPAGTMKTFQVPTNTGNGSPRSFAYDAERQRLYFTSTNSATAASLRWIELGGDCDPGETLLDGGCTFGIANLGVYITGTELTGLALATAAAAGAPPRLFIAARLYDAEIAAATGLRPASDVGGKLLVVDLLPQADGRPLGQIASTIDIGLGASEVRLLPRTGRPDLVAVTASERGTVWLYDDETGAAYPLTDDPVTGAPLAGEQPFGLAVGPSDAGPGAARLYVGSFMDGFVTPFDVPLDAPQDAHVVMDRRIGQEQP
jgi:hypothetical protein